MENSSLESQLGKGSFKGIEKNPCISVKNLFRLKI